MDIDGNGLLDFDEMKAAAQSSDQTNQLTPEEIMQIMDNLDYDKNRKINYNEFLAASINV